MFNKILADFVVLVHFLWIVFLFLGAIWGSKHKAVKITHFSGLLFAILIQVFGWYCPLTHFEFGLRSKHDPALAYAGSFIVHYVEQIVYIELSRPLILVLTVFLLGFNAWFYLRKKKTY
jgi:hypothetical protein